MTPEQERDYRALALSYASGMQWINTHKDLINTADQIYSWLVNGKKAS